MPPRKRARLSQATSPAARATPEPVASDKAADTDLLDDAWTDEEEIGLFKGLIRWKPTGIHKHFRMLQLREYLLDNNYIHHKAEHTQIAGIWHKLNSLYDLEALDQREDARQLSDLSDEDEEEEEEDGTGDDTFSNAENKVHRQPFILPEEDYGEEMWKQRLTSAKEQRDESPPTLPELNLVDKAPVKFTPSFSIEPEDAPVTRRGARQSKVGVKAKPAATTSRRSRRKGDSVTAESEDAGSEDDDNSQPTHSEAEDAEEENDDDEDDEGASETSAPAVRGRGRGRGRGTARGRPRGRRR